MVQCVVQATPALLAVAVVMIVTVVVLVTMTVVMTVVVTVLVTVLGVAMIVAVAVIVTVGIQLEQDGAHHGIRAGVQSQGVVAGVEMESAAPFEGQCFLQKITIEREFVTQVEGMQVNDLIDCEIGLLGMQDFGDRVNGPDLALEV
jgi:hypothetical protein